MIDNKKNIIVNPQAFQFPTAGNTRKKRTPRDPNKPIRIKSEKQHNRTVKNNKNRLLKYIREQQEKKYKQFSEQPTSNVDYSTPTTESTSPSADNSVESDFNNSLKYLLSVAEKTQNAIPNRVRHNSTLRHLPSFTHTTPAYSDNTNLPNVFSDIEPTTTDSSIHIRRPFPDTPTYGCLKNGTLPTYRMWKNQTMKNPPSVNHNTPGHSDAPALSNPPRSPPTFSPSSSSSLENSVPPQIHNPAPKPQPPAVYSALSHASTIGGTTRRETMDDVRAHQSFFKKRFPQPGIKRAQKQKRILRRTFRLGKSKHYPNVSVLVSNKTIRNQTTLKTQLLKQVPIEEIKKTLIKKGLIKIGTTAPNDVLRKMYESISLICGDLQNHNPENLLYNYFNAGDKL
jgi:hypothetical protein